MPETATCFPQRVGPKITIPTGRGGRYLLCFQHMSDSKLIIDLCLAPATLIGRFREDAVDPKNIVYRPITAPHHPIYCLDSTLRIELTSYVGRVLGGNVRILFDNRVMV